MRNPISTKNPVPGRPCFEPGKASDTWLQVRLTEAQKRHYAKHAKPASLSQWVKLTLDKASKYQASPPASRVKSMIKESHKRQFNGEDYQMVAYKLSQVIRNCTEDELAELETSPDPGCQCGFCKTAPWE